jgi:hypothetical protein
MNVTHGRHCPCTACKQEDWTNPRLAPCGMHGPGCPAAYAPIERGHLATQTGNLRCTGFGDCGCLNCWPPEPEYPLADHGQTLGLWRSLWIVLRGARFNG